MGLHILGNYSSFHIRLVEVGMAQLVVGTRIQELVVRMDHISLVIGSYNYAWWVVEKDNRIR